MHLKSGSLQTSGYLLVAAQMPPWLPPQGCWPFAADLGLQVWACFMLLVLLLLQICGVLCLGESKLKSKRQFSTRASTVTCSSHSALGAGPAAHASKEQLLHVLTCHSCCAGCCSCCCSAACCMEPCQEVELVRSGTPAGAAALLPAHSSLVH